MAGRVFLAPLILVLAAAGAAEAQFGGGGMGGGMGGGGGGHHGGGRHRQDKADAPHPAGDQPRAPVRQTSLSKVMIDGVITGIDPATGRVTIKYGDVDALNWSAGTTPFAVEKPALLQGLSVGEKVRFHVESQQISAIQPQGPSGTPSAH